MKITSKVFRILERALLAVGLLLIALFTFGHIDQFVMFHAAMARFEAQKKTVENIPTAKEGSTETLSPRTEPYQAKATALWSVQRIEAYDAALGEPVETLAILRIPKINLEVPVLNGTDKFTLNHGVGRITGTSLPGQQGNIGIAGHRDGFFRGLKDLANGDAIELVTTSGTDVYVVDRIHITNPGDVSVLHARANPSLTLVTCYPFYFVGPAPSRYVVEASLRE